MRANKSRRAIEPWKMELGRGGSWGKFRAGEGRWYEDLRKIQGAEDAN